MDTSLLNGDATNRKWYSESPLQWYAKTIPFSDVFPDLNPQSVTREKLQCVWGPHDLGKFSDFEREKEGLFCRIGTSGAC